MVWLKFNGFCGFDEANSWEESEEEVPCSYKNAEIEPGSYSDSKSLTVVLKNSIYVYYGNTNVS